MSTTRYIVKNSGTDKIYLGTSTPPQTLEGATGDREGMIAVDSNHLYYCTDDYTGASGPANIWKSVELSPVTTQTYRALLSQTGVFTGTSIATFNGALIVGETYTITNYVAGDDFSNIANVISGSINTTGCEFIATGEVPVIWTNSSQLESSGNIVAQVLENTLGFDIEWSIVSPGVYVGYKNYAGGNGFFNDFPRSQVSVSITQSIFPILSGPFPPGPFTQFAGPSSFSVKDDSIAVVNFNYDPYVSENNWLYFTPIEVKINKNIDTTPIVISGEINAEFPFSNASFTFEDSLYGFVDNVYSGVGTVVNNIEELVDLFNNNTNTNYFGTFAYDGSPDGITLTMPTNLKEQFSPNGVLSISVFSD